MIVNVRTPEEWEFVVKNSKLRKQLDSIYWNEFGSDSCISISNNSYDSIKYFKHKDIITSFEDYCDLEWYPKVGDWVKVISYNYICHKPKTVNERFQIKSITDGYKLHSKETGNVGWIHNKHVLPTSGPKSLHDEAKERYPIGSKFYDLVNGVEFEVASHSFDNFGDHSVLYVPVKPHPERNNKSARIWKSSVWATKLEESKEFVKSTEPCTETEIPDFYSKSKVKLLDDTIKTFTIPEYKTKTKTNQI